MDGVPAFERIKDSDIEKGSTEFARYNLVLASTRYYMLVHAENVANGLAFQVVRAFHDLGRKYPFLIGPYDYDLFDRAMSIVFEGDFIIRESDLILYDDIVLTQNQTSDIQIFEEYEAIILYSF